MVPAGTIPYRAAGVAAFLLAGVAVARAPAAGDREHSVPRLGAIDTTMTTVQDARRAPRSTSDKLPEQLADCDPAQADRSPRCALHRVQLVLVGPCAPFWGATSVPLAARTSAKNACTHRANGMWRYHLVPLRTSS
jgi:hypothetical protein